MKLTLIVAVFQMAAQLADGQLFIMFLFMMADTRRRQAMECTWSFFLTADHSFTWTGINVSITELGLAAENSQSAKARKKVESAISKSLRKKLKKAEYNSRKLNPKANKRGRRGHKGGTGGGAGKNLTKKGYAPSITY